MQGICILCPSAGCHGVLVAFGILADLASSVQVQVLDSKIPNACFSPQVATVFVLIIFNLGRRREGEASAYSIFNNHQRLPGQVRPCAFCNSATSSLQTVALRHPVGCPQGKNVWVELVFAGKALTRFDPWGLKRGERLTP